LDNTRPIAGGENGIVRFLKGFLIQGTQIMQAAGVAPIFPSYTIIIEKPYLLGWIQLKQEMLFLQADMCDRVGVEFLECIHE
jgi:hypothetical protein